MAMVVKNNLSALNTLNVLNNNTNALSKSLSKVSSGLKVRGAADDASGFSISERMKVQVRSLDQDKANTQNGNSMMKVAEGAVASTIEILKTLKEKVINAANDTNTDADRKTIQKELDQSIDQINDNALVTFNGKYLVDGSHNKAVVENGTKTALCNQSLAEATRSGSALTDLKNRNGETLNIHGTDSVTVSFVVDGKTTTYTTAVGTKTLTEVLTAAQGGGNYFSINAGGTSFIGTDASGNRVTTASGGSALTITAQTGGVQGQIAGLTISITSNTGDVNKSANAALDNFVEEIRAENESTDNSMVFQIGTKANQSIKVGMTDMRAEALGLKGFDGKTINIGTQEKANAAINVLDTAIQKALDQQASIGAAQSRLEYTASNLTTASENVTAAQSTYTDADMAKEMTEYTKNNVLMQAAQAMLAQANQSSSNVLSLLQ